MSEWVEYKPGRYILVKEGDAPAPRQRRRPGSIAAGQVSVSLGVDPSQVPDNIAFNKLHGIRPTEYTDDGCPIFTSQRHAAEYARVRGCHNRDGVMG